MKKTLAIFMTLALIASLVAGFAVSSDAAPAFVEPTYKYSDMLDAEYGKHAETMEADENGGRDSLEGYSFMDGLWTYEYYDQADNTFKPMSSYYEKAQPGWQCGGWENLYIANSGAVWSWNDYSYCMIYQDGKYLHPGSKSGPTITFIVPADGTISYDLSIYMYNGGSSAEGTGNKLFVYQNDTKIWPSGEDVVIFADTDGSGNPYEVSVNAIKVKEGDKIRFMLHTALGANGGLGTALAETPVVTYHEASVPIGDPKGSAPENVIVERVGKDTTDVRVVWDAALNAAGYNVYVKSDSDAAPVKVNAEPITGCEYTVTGLKGKTLYDLTVTTVTKAGGESDPSVAQTFMTVAGQETDPVVDPATTDGPGNPATSGKPSDTSAKPSSGNGEEKGGLPIWILISLIAGGVVIVALVVVVVLLLVKKKPALPADAPAEEPKNE